MTRWRTLHWHWKEAAARRADRPPPPLWRRRKRGDARGPQSLSIRSGDGDDRCARQGRRNRPGRSRARRCPRGDLCAPGVKFLLRCVEIRSSFWCSSRGVLQHAAFDLIGFDGFEQRAEVAFAEAFIALAPNEFEKDGTNGVLSEYLEQQSLILAAVYQNAVALHAFDIFTMALEAVVDAFVIGFGAILKGYAFRAKSFDGFVNICRAQR